MTAPPGEARTDLDILMAVSRMLGHEMGYTSAQDAMDENAGLTPDFAGVTYGRLGRTGLRWPVAPSGVDGDIVSVRSPVRYVFTGFHFPEVRTNSLIEQSVDVNTDCAGFKVMAVDVRPVQGAPSRTPALAAGD